MKFWRVMDYRTESGINLIGEWYLRLAPEVQATFDQTLNAAVGIRDWAARKPPEIRELDRDFPGLWELRFTLDKEIKYRPVGVITQQPGRFAQGEFVLLLGCHKRFGTYAPDRAFEYAQALRAELAANRGTVHEHII